MRPDGGPDDQLDDAAAAGIRTQILDLALALKGTEPRRSGPSVSSPVKGWYKLRLMSSACVPTDATRKTGRLLRQAREQAGITQQELAERLGCSQPAISQAEAGGASLSVATLQRFLDALGYDLELGIVSRDVALTEGVPGIIRPRGART